MTTTSRTVPSSSTVNSSSTWSCNGADAFNGASASTCVNNWGGATSSANEGAATANGRQSSTKDERWHGKRHAQARRVEPNENGDCFRVSTARGRRQLGRYMQQRDRRLGEERPHDDVRRFDMAGQQLRPRRRNRRRCLREMKCFTSFFAVGGRSRGRGVPHRSAVVQMRAVQLVRCIDQLVTECRVTVQHQRDMAECQRVCDEHQR